MLESIVEYLRSADPVAIYIFLFFISFLENVVPPIPGDVPVAFVGYLTFSSDIDFWLSVAFASAGSTLGFMLMFLLSRKIGLRIYAPGESRVRHGLVKAIHKMFPPDQMEAARQRFSTHGYFAVLINRFLFGYRAVISVMSGFLHLNVTGVCAAALASSIVWYVLLLRGGYLLGENWQWIGAYMAVYSIPLTLVFLVVVFVALFRYLKGRGKKGRI
ncbi:VTT domain-containing protein [Prosthecochloris sp.]|uniref:DedA family protein n=1 Tax=Prosthecochloris sp. TaxID=290513 RepID=UPI00257CEA8A|nr:VTT domain-containing protein [Prosthecochloris sp.]